MVPGVDVFQCPVIIPAVSPEVISADIHGICWGRSFLRETTKYKSYQTFSSAHFCQDSTY
jgi:hypothetical protein